MAAPRALEVSKVSLILPKDGRYQFIRLGGYDRVVGGTVGPARRVAGHRAAARPNSAAIAGGVLRIGIAAA